MPEDLTPIIGINEITDEIKNIYDIIDVNCSENLIFGDTIHRPWTLSFNQLYVLQRLNNINKYTKEILKK